MTEVLAYSYCAASLQKTQETLKTQQHLRRTDVSQLLLGQCCVAVNAVHLSITADR